MQPLRVLIVEDEGMVAMLIEDMLADLGHEVVGVAARMDDALRAAAEGEGFDVAIVDVNLDGRPSYPVADRLRARRLPFVFATGYGAAGLDPRYRGVPTLAKPFLRDDLEAALSRALRRE